VEETLGFPLPNQFHGYRKVPADVLKAEAQINQAERYTGQQHHYNNLKPERHTSLRVAPVI
jgi:hypothetical protein